jgi:hypothetical protein
MNMTKQLGGILTIFVSLLFISSQCNLGEIRYRLQLNNNSEDTIECYFGFDGESDGIYYPDTSIVLQYDPGTIYKARPGWYCVNTRPIEWGAIISSLPRDTMSIFIFHTDTVKKYSWDMIRSGYRVLKRYDLSAHDIELLDYEIPFPPTELMKSMKMWPGFNEQKLIQGK